MILVVGVEALSRVVVGRTLVQDGEVGLLGAGLRVDRIEPVLGRTRVPAHILLVGEVDDSRGRVDDRCGGDTREGEVTASLLARLVEGGADLPLPQDRAGHRVEAVDPVRLGGDDQHALVVEWLTVDSAGELRGEELTEVAARDAGGREIRFVWVPPVTSVVAVVGVVVGSGPCSSRGRRHHRDSGPEGARKYGDHERGREDPPERHLRTCPLTHHANLPPAGLHAASGDRPT